MSKAPNLVTKLMLETKYDDKIKIMLNISAQKRNGFKRRGIRFEKKPLMSQSRPRSNAPDNIKNNAMPILKKLFANRV